MKRTLARIGLLVVSTSIALALAEGLVRVAYPEARDSVIPGHIFQIDDTLGWRLAPSRTTHHRTPYFDAQYTTNTFGFRDPPRTIDKVDCVHRILLYGDSLIFGWGLNDSERFSTLVERESPNLEIWNHAIPGYGLDQEIILYQNEGDSLNADEVTFFAGRSTLRRTHAGFIYGKFKPRFVEQADGTLHMIPVPHGSNLLINFLYEFAGSFYLPYLIQTSLAPTIRPVDAAGRPEIDPGIIALLTNARETARQRNQRMSILVADLIESDRQQLRAFCRDADVSCLEISLAGRASTASDIIFGERDFHWNANANRLIAAEIREQLDR